MGAQTESATAAAGRPQPTLLRDGQGAQRYLHDPENSISSAEIIALHAAQASRARLSENSPLTNGPRWRLAVKRLVDIVGSLSLIVLLSPVMAAAAAAVRLTSRGPVLFSQKRVGRNGTEFEMLKFRSMSLDAEERLADVYSLNEQTGPVFKFKNDPRVTRVGRLLRRSSIDELPQLFHVLAGTMSLVGPRPALPAEVEYYTHYARQRLLAKPGLTCIWQVNGRSTVDFDRWVEMDLDYIEQWSLGMDLRLLSATVPAVLSGDGAY